MDTNISDYKWEQSQSKSKQFGEVFTPDNIVKEMLKLADEKLEKPEPEPLLKSKNSPVDININKAEKYIRKKILEPSCGDGNILIRILYNKMEAIPKMVTESQKIRLLLMAVSNIYGVDVQYKMTKIAQERLFLVATGNEVSTFDTGGKSVSVPAIDLGIRYTDELKEDIRAIIRYNIICGNTLTGHRYKVNRNSEESTDNREDADLKWRLLFTEYSFAWAGVCQMQDYWCHPIKDTDGNTMYIIDEEPTQSYEIVELGKIKDRKVQKSELTEEQKAILEIEKKAQEDIDNGTW